MASEEEVEMYNEIINKGCCQRCALRYMGQCKTLITFDDPEICLVNFGFIPFMTDIIAPKEKRKKYNPCSVCLGLLQDTILNGMLEQDDLKKVDVYDHKTFVAYISFPTCILVRDHSMKIYLKKNFPDHFDVSKVIKINNAWRYSIENRLCQILKKNYHHHSKLTLHFHTNYVLEEDEMAVVQTLIKDKSQKNSVSKHCVSALLETVLDTNFENYITVPPRVPLYEVTLKELKCFSESIHLMGNYIKFSRDLPQVSHLKNENDKTEYSIENIIFNAFKNTLGPFNDMVFKASSFEDRSVRVLGSGRTFQLQLIDPKFDSVSNSQCREIEKKIKSTNLLIVKNLKEADRRDISVVMDSEKLSPKSYKILCYVYDCKNIDYCVNAVNMYRNILVYQKTPIKHMDQRVYKTKRKKIFNIKAVKVEGKNYLIELDICAEAGLYLEEFVNGDFGRTQPYLGQIMKASVDLLAVDVVDFSSTLPCAAEEEDVVI